MLIINSSRLVEGLFQMSLNKDPKYRRCQFNIDQSSIAHIRTYVLFWAFTLQCLHTSKTYFPQHQMMHITRAILREFRHLRLYSKVVAKISCQFLSQLTGKSISEHFSIHPPTYKVICRCRNKRGAIRENVPPPHAKTVSPGIFPRNSNSFSLYFSGDAMGCRSRVIRINTQVDKQSIKLYLLFGIIV